MPENESNSLSITAELLGLSDITVVGVRTRLSANEIIITVKSTREFVHCRLCGKLTKSHGYGRPLRLRHLSLFGQDTYIEITPRRGKCEDCDDDPTTTETLDWYTANGKYTKPFEQRMLFELVNSTLSDVSHREGVDYHALEGIIDRYIETEPDFSAIKSLNILGLDEISMKKGYRDFVTLITYRADNKVKILGIVKGREKTDIIAFLRNIPIKLRKTITAVCCDLYNGYMNAAKEVFGESIPVVADRFHVRRLYRKSLVNLRKSELSRLKKELSDEEYAKLKPAIALLRKQKDYFTEEEKVIVKPLFSLSPKLKEGYHFSRTLTGIFDSNISPKEAKEELTDWVTSVNESGLTCFNKFIKTLGTYKEQICNYFIKGDSSGFVEGFNNKVKVLKRRCYGLSTVTRLFQRLILDTVGFERFHPRVAVF